MRDTSPARRLVASAAGLAVALTGLVATAPSAGATPAGDELVISEIYGGGGNTNAPFKNDFIELYNPTAAPVDLSAYSVTAHQSSGPAYGAAQALTGTLAPGKHYLIQEGAGSGTSMPDLPTPDLVPAQPYGMAGTNTSVQLYKNGVVVDAIGTGSATLKEGTATAAMSNTTSASRNAAGTDTDNNVADFTLGAPTPTASGAGPVDPPDPVDETLTIAEIQGTGADSPKVGVNATTTGVVTAKYPEGGYNGFVIQTGGPDTTPDASDGLFIYAPGNDQTSFQLGDTVTVTGLVSEFSGATQITAATIAQAATAQPAVVAKTLVPGTDCALPGTACLDAAALATAREKVESELFEPAGAFTVTDVYDGSSYNGGSFSSANYGDLGLAALSDTPLYNPTEVVAPSDSAALAARKAYNDAHRIILDDGSSLNFSTAANTGKPTSWQTADHVVRVGSTATFPGGTVLLYRNGIFALNPTTQVVGAPTAAQPQFTQTREDAPATLPGDLKLATFNVLNYFTTLGVDVVGCTNYTDRAGVPVAVNSCPGNGPRGAWDQTNFERQQTKIVKAINALGADVVSLEELENSRKVDGADRDEAIGALVAALNADAGSTRWAFAPSPTVLPAVAEEDVIRNGFIYNPATVDLAGAGKILTGSAPFANAREPLAQAFKPKDGTRNQRFVVIVNHFKSKGASGATGDNVDPGTGVGGYNGDRTRQAGALVTFANDFAASKQIDKVFLTGDFNSYSKEDPVKVLEDAGFIALESTDNPAERSYNFDGGIGSLDHVFANASANAWVKGVDIWEVNANETVYRQYSRYNYNVTDLYAPDVFAASDHNPEVVGFTPDASVPDGPDPIEVQVLGTNDFHGRLLANGDEAGAAQFAGAVAQLRSENPNTVFAAGGDLIGASTFESFIQQDKPTLDALNAAGLDVSAAGNHEFDQGYEDLADRVMAPYDATSNKYGGAKWQYLAANVRKKSDNSYALPDVAASPGNSDGATWMTEVDGVKVGFIGTVTEDLPALVTPGGIADIKVSSIVDETNTAAARLKAEGAEIVVMLTHEGAASTALSASTDTSTTFGKIVAGVGGDVDAIISGHTHLAYNHRIDGRPVVSAGQYGTNLNRIVFEVDPTTRAVTIGSQEIVKANEVQVTAPAASQVKADVTTLVTAAQNEADVLGAAELGKLGHAFNRATLANGSENRGGESTLGNLVAEAQRWAAGTDIAFMNPGGLRADMVGTPGGYPAVLTYKQAALVQPFANTLVNQKYTGAQIKTILEQQWQRDAAGNVPSRPFLRLGASKGFRYTYDPTRAEGDRITGMWLNGVPIDAATQYTVTMNSFLASGGDNFREFANGTAKTDTGQSDLNAMVNYMADQQGTPVVSTWAQQAVGVTRPATEPAGYRAGETGHLQLSSLAFTGAGDVQDTKVIAQAGANTTIGQAPVDNTRGTVLSDENGTATLPFTIPAGTPAGDFTFVVKGDRSGTEIPVTVTVHATPKADSTVTVTADPGSIPAQVGTSTLTVTVTSTGVTPTGVVTAQVGSRVVGGGDLVDGTVSFEVGPFAAAGVQQVVVKYLGDAATKPSQGSVEVTVTKAPVVEKEEPKVKAKVKPSTLVVNTDRGTATVTVTRRGGEVTGTVIARVGNKVVGAGEVVNGTATIRLAPFTRVGHATVTFSYLGDDNTLPGTDSERVRVVKADAKVGIAAPSRMTVGRASAVTVTVKAPGQVVHGLVSVKAHGKTLRAKVRGGTAVVMVTPRKAGKLTLKATFQPTATIRRATSKPVNFTVVKR